MGLIKNLKKSVEKIDDAQDKIKQKSIETVEQLKHTKEIVAEAKEMTAKHTQGAKAEVQDLKRVFDRDELIYFKTDEMAIVLRKLGGLDQFLDVVNKLTKEGYLLVWAEDVQNVTTTFGINVPGIPYKLGSFYYFQHSKYLA
jgi:hypothetical protein